jgi:hypothetical protein
MDANLPSKEMYNSRVDLNVLGKEIYLALMVSNKGFLGRRLLNLSVKCTARHASSKQRLWIDKEIKCIHSTA